MHILTIKNSKINFQQTQKEKLIKNCAFDIFRISVFFKVDITPVSCKITLLSVWPTKQSKMFQHAQLPTTDISILLLWETSFFDFVLMVSTIVRNEKV